MTNFADKLAASVTNNNSLLCAGFDPILDNFPNYVTSQASAKFNTTEDAVNWAISSFYETCLSVLSGKVAAIKPNIAFFEQYGVGGIRAFARLCAVAKDLGVPVIADAKRGDIGSTAEAYALAFLGKPTAFGKPIDNFSVDAVTVNPFLGFDTLEPFCRACEEHGKGLFVLVKTSNPGGGDIQDIETSGQTVSEKIAHWLEKRGQSLTGTSGFSSIGAVVGATYPAQARALREQMPHALFLVPGYGAQGGTAKDARAGLLNGAKGGVIQASRALFQGTHRCETSDSLGKVLIENINRINQDLST